MRFFYFVLWLWKYKIDCQICSEQESWMILFFRPSFLLKISKMQPTLEEANAKWFIFNINIESSIRLYMYLKRSKLSKYLGFQISLKQYPTARSAFKVLSFKIWWKHFETDHFTSNLIEEKRADKGLVKCCFIVFFKHFLFLISFSFFANSNI